LNKDEAFQELWNDYLEGDITSDGLVELQKYFAKDDQLLQFSADSFQIHRLLGYNAVSEMQSEAFVQSTMAQLRALQPENRVTTSGCSAVDSGGPSVLPAGRFLMGMGAVAASALLALIYFLSSTGASEAIIARTTSVHGTIEWTHENGVVEFITETGMPLTGGTLETMTGDSTVTMQFTDGTIVTLDGLSMLTISEQEQKILRLRRGNLSADVQPQPTTKPMMVYTEAAELRVVGTQFNVNTRDESTKLTVNEGEVLLRRTTDGESVNVVPHHQVVASLSDTSQLRSVQRADQVHRWKSDLQTEASHGQWIPSLLELGRKLKSAVINGNISEQAATIAYKKAASLNDQQGSLWALPSRFGLSVVVTVNQQATVPIVLESGSRLRVTGRGYSATELVVGITTNEPDGGFSGKYEQHIDLTKSMDPDTQEFSLEFPIESMSVINEKFPASPIGREFVGCWCSHPTNQVTKFKITGIEIIGAEPSK